MQTETAFGKINFRVSSKARRINVRILENGLLISLPQGCTTDEAMQFVNKAADKIMVKQKKLKKQTTSNIWLLTENHTLQTNSFDINFRIIRRNDIFFRFENRELTIDFPEHIDHRTDSAQKKCWKGISYFLRKEATRHLTVRTNELAREHGFAYADVKIQSSRTRWGSCSRYKNINLSLYLMLLPDHLIDYVILHELCHTRQMNHSEKFWHEMDKVTGNNSKTLRRELKSYRIPEH